MKTTTKNSITRLKKKCEESKEKSEQKKRAHSRAYIQIIYIKFTLPANRSFYSQRAHKAYVVRCVCVCYMCARGVFQQTLQVLQHAWFHFHDAYGAIIFFYNKPLSLLLWLRLLYCCYFLLSVYSQTHTYTHSFSSLSSCGCAKSMVFALYFFSR